MIFLLVIVDISVDEMKGEVGMSMRSTERGEMGRLTSCRKYDEP